MTIIRPLIVDLSFWNGAVNFDMMKLAGVAAVGIRASWLYEDTMFKTYWQAAKIAGIPRFAYHYLDWRGSEIGQATLFNSLLYNDPGELPPVLDLEMDAAPYSYSLSRMAEGRFVDLMPKTRKVIGSRYKPLKYYLPKKMLYTLSPNQVQGKVWNWLTSVEKTLGRKPMIYSGYYYWKQWMTADMGWLPYKLWLAWYAAESVIKVPAPWSAWTYWQWTGNGNGPQYGSSGKSLDESWFNGTQAQLQTMITGTPIPTPAPLVCPFCGKQLPAGWSYVKP